MLKDDALGQLHALFEDEWQFRLRENPTFATYCGDHRYNDRLPNQSQSEEARRNTQLRDFQERLQQIDRSVLPASEQLNYDIFARELDIQLQNYRFSLHLMPLTRLSGFHIYIADLVFITPFQTMKDYQDYIKRLSGFKRYFQGHIELMRRGMTGGYIPSTMALHEIDLTITGHIVADPVESVFFKPFQQFPVGVPVTMYDSLRAGALGAIQHSVIPAYQELHTFLIEEYLPAARQEVAASTLPSGADYYAYCVHRYTTLDTTPQQVHEIGVREVRRIRSEMEAVIRKLEFPGSFHEFIQFLRTEKRFYVGAPEELMKEVAWIMKRIEGELPRLFKTLPRTPFGLRQIPDYLAPNSTSAYYFPAGGDGKTAGYYYVNTYDLKSRPLYEYEALSLHEAVPGHHLQIALQLELVGVPDFRRFADATAFVEGWALYAERLGLEAGFYRDPYNDFGRLIFEIWRACRLVVDTGLHALGWTRQQAIDYMTENTALTQLNIANEVDRYIAWPGQALAYKMGELKIRELRRLAEQRLGSRFDLREFHDHLLDHGAIPLDILEKLIVQWLDAQEKQFNTTGS